MHIYTVYIIIHYMARRHYILIDLLYPNTSKCYIYIYIHTRIIHYYSHYISQPLYVYIYTYLYQYMFISLYIYINIYIYTYTYICMYIYTYFKFQHTYIYIVVDSPLYPQIINPPNAQATVETSIAGTKVLRG